MTISNQNLNIENNPIERRNTNPNNNENLNTNIANYNPNNQINSVNARENSVNEMSNLYFNIFSEVNNQNNFEVGNDNELVSGRNFDNELDEVFQNLTYLINSERYSFN
jgi:hypothetical protein